MIPMAHKDPQSPKNDNPSSDLTYYIFEGLLVGYANGHMVHISAVSGGAGGSTKEKAAFSMNNPYMEALKTVGSGKQHVHGGPIPPGSYKIEKPGKHPHLGLSARLDHLTKKPPMGRDGFFIHGRGPHGSDGCIVPLDATDFQKLMKNLEATDGGSLVVVETTDGGQFA